MSKAASRGESTTELLNPQRSSGVSDASTDSEAGRTETSALVLRFGDIDPADYKTSCAYIAAHPEILDEMHAEALLIRAHQEAVKDARSLKTRRYVHQSVLLQNCRLLGAAKLVLLSRSLATPGNEAGRLLREQVADKLRHILKLAAEQRKDERRGGEEKIQLQAVEPGAKVTVRVPEGGAAAAVFERLAPGLREAVRRGSLEEVNEELAAMSVEEGERMVTLLTGVCLDMRSLLFPCCRVVC